MAKRPRINDSNDPLNKSDLVLTGLEQVSQSTSQQSNKSTTKPNPNSSSQNNDNLTSIESNKSNSQVANKLSLRKSTFQISEPVLERLEKVHLGLQLQFGKANAPYKEVIVEEALVINPSQTIHYNKF